MTIGLRALVVELSAGLLLVGVSGCVSTSDTHGTGRTTGKVFPFPSPDSPAGAEPSQRPPVDAGAAGAPDSPAAPVFGLPPNQAPAPAPQSPAISGLMQRARAELSAGRPDQAAILLERAQRIEPRNAPVWAMLAQTRLLQARPDQAEALASKSNSLAHGDPYVMLENWRTIASARQQQGDAAGALQAQAQIESLQRALYGSTP